MASHNVHEQLYSAKSVSEHIINPPASGGTIVLGGKDGGLVLGNTSSNETWYLPAEEDTPLGTEIFISNASTGTLTIRNDTPTTIGTVSSGEIVAFVLSANRTWTTGGSDLAADLASTASGKGANLIGYQDSGGKTDSADVDAVLDEVYVALTGTGRIGVPLTSVLMQDGTVMAKQATTVTGFAQLADKNIVIHIPANSTAESFAASINSSPDWNQSTDSLVLNVVVSKSADADTLTLDAEIYALDGTAWSSDGYGASAAVAITQAISTLQFPAVDEWSAGLVSQATALAFVLTLGGTNDGDVVYIHDIYWTYLKKLLTA